MNLDLDGRFILEFERDDATKRVEHTEKQGTTFPFNIACRLVLAIRLLNEGSNFLLNLSGGISSNCLFS